MPTLTITVDNAIPKNGMTFRAPKGMMYDIKHISGIVHDEAVNVNVGVFVRAFEERTAVVLPEIAGPTSDLIYIIDLSTLNNTVEMSYPEPERTKHITVVRGDGIGFSATLMINYSLVKVSITDLVWEFLRRGKNP